MKKEAGLNLEILKEEMEKEAVASKDEDTNEVSMLVDDVQMSHDSPTAFEEEREGDSSLGMALIVSLTLTLYSSVGFLAERKAWNDERESMCLEREEAEEGWIKSVTAMKVHGYRGYSHGLT